MRRARWFLLSLALVGAVLLARITLFQHGGHLAADAGEGSTRQAAVPTPGDETVVDDVTRLNPTPVRGVLSPATRDELVTMFGQAKASGLKVSIAGKRHSQGGQTAYRGGVVLDMTRLNRIVAIDPERRRITVESGASWEDVQNVANAHGLAVKVQQSSNIFTVGGSLSVNAHGRDPNFGPVVETVQAFRLLQPGGSIIDVSRTENPELFALAIGGYGLFGVIVDADLELTDNSVLEKRTVAMSYRDYPPFFLREVKGHPEVELHYARPSIAERGFLEKMTVTSLVRTTKRPKKIFELKEETGVERNKAFLELSRGSQWGKNLRWFAQEQLVDRPGATTIVSRNNAMRPEVKFLEYSSSADTDILQEYFVPPRNFVRFMDGLRGIVLRDRVNLLSATIRWVKSDQDSFLRYAREDCFGVVLYLNQRTSEEGTAEARRWTRALVDLTTELEGVYYLPYQRYPSSEQIRRAYPMLDEFFRKKKERDPDETFVSAFYEAYRR
jgi:FAD/FMN-containing dehydrogenase